MVKKVTYVSFLYGGKNTIYLWNVLYIFLKTYYYDDNDYLFIYNIFCAIFLIFLKILYCHLFINLFIKWNELDGR